MEWTSEAVVAALAAAAGWVGRHYKSDIDKEQDEVTVASALVDMSLRIKDEVEEALAVAKQDWRREVTELQQEIDTLRGRVRTLEVELESWKSLATEARIEWIKAHGEEPPWMEEA